MRYLLSFFDFLEGFAIVHLFGFGDSSALRFGGVQAPCVVPFCFGHAIGNLYKRRWGSMDRLLGSIAARSTGPSLRGACVLYCAYCLRGCRKQRKRLTGVRAHLVSVIVRSIALLFAFTLPHEHISSICSTSPWLPRRIGCVCQAKTLPGDAFLPRVVSF